jgi:hypothetical protein
MVSLHSKKGQAVLEHQRGYPEPWRDTNHPAASH